MKKIIATIATAMFLISCGGSSEESAIADSLAVDTAAVTANDSSVAEIKADEGNGLGAFPTSVNHQITDKIKSK